MVETVAVDVTVDFPPSLIQSEQRQPLRKAAACAKS